MRREFGLTGLACVSGHSELGGRDVALRAVLARMVLENQDRFMHATELAVGQEGF